MKKYHLNKKEIFYWANKTFKYLYMPKIPIIIKKIFYPSIEKSIPSYLPDEKYIRFPQIVSNLIVDRGWDNHGIKLNDSREWCVFALFHEIAHYFQWYYYRKWFDKFAGYKYYINFNGNHQDKHIERNADKIAIILFKKLYKEI